EVLKSCTLARPLTYPSIHPGRPSLFSALDRHSVVLYDRRCFKAPVCIIDVPEDVLGRGMPSRAVWCPSDINKLMVHYRTAQKAVLIQFNRYPDCSQLSDFACHDEEVGPNLFRHPETKEEEGEEKHRWAYKMNDEYPIALADHLLAEEDMNGGLMEAAPFPHEWKDSTEPLLWRPQFDLTTLSFAGSRNALRRTVSDVDISTFDDDENCVQPIKRYMGVARDRTGESLVRECVEWTIWDQTKRVKSMRRTRSEERQRKRTEEIRMAQYAETVDLKRPIRVIKTPAYDPDLQKNEIMYPVYTSKFVDQPNMERITQMPPSEWKEVEYFAGRTPVKDDHFDYSHTDFENADTTVPPGPVVTEDVDDMRCDHPLNHSRIPYSYGSLYYGIQGRPLRQMRSVMDHAKFYITHDHSRDAEMTRAKKKRLMKDKRRDDIMKLLMDEEADLMSANDCRWINLHEIAEGGCDPEEPKYDLLVQKLRKGRIHDSDDSDNSSSLDPHDDTLQRHNDVRQVQKNNFQYVHNRSMFDVTRIRRPTATQAHDFLIFELPVEDPESFCVFSYSQEMIVQGAPRDVRGGPQIHFMKVPNSKSLPKITQPRLGFVQVPDMSVYLRSILGANTLQSVKQVKKTGFGEFKGADIPKGYIDTLKHLRKHVEDSEGNRFALDYIERLFKDNHHIDHDRGFPRRFEVENPVYSDTTDEDDPKKKKKKIVFTTHDDRPKMEQLKEKLLKIRRAKFLKRRRACEELKIDHDGIFTPKEAKKQKKLLELVRKGDPKRTILDPPIPKELYEKYSGSSDSNEEAHYLPKIVVRDFKNKEEYDFDVEEQKIAMETREIEIIKAFRLRGEIPPLEFEYDDDGNMLAPKSATLEEEHNMDICTTRTLLRRMLERDARVHELKRRREMLLDRLPEEVAEDTYDKMMSDLRLVFDELETTETPLHMRGYFFKHRREQRCKTINGRGWKRNRKLQHKYLNDCLNLCDRVCKFRRQIRENAEVERKKEKDLRKARKEAKKLLREIARRDVSGFYMSTIMDYQFRKNQQLRDFDLYDFLESFEELTIQMCGRQFSSHHQLIRKITRRRKNMPGRFDKGYHEEVRAVLTDQSDSEAENRSVSSSPSDSSSTLSFEPLRVEGRKRRLVKKRGEGRRMKSCEKEERESSVDSKESRGKKEKIDDDEDEEDEGTIECSSSEGEPVDEIEPLDNNPPEYLPSKERLFFESAAASMPISALAPNRVDTFKQLIAYGKLDLKPPPGIKEKKTKRIKNRKARKKRDWRMWMAAQAKMKEERRERDKILFDEMLELAERWCISSPTEREEEWRRRREKGIREAKNVMLPTSPARAVPHRSLTRKFLDKLRIGGGPKAIRLYPNGSIYPPPRVPASRIFDKFDPYTNSFARKFARKPYSERRPRPTFLADRDEEELSFGYDLGNEKSMFPPNEFSFPLKLGEKMPNNVQWMFPRYWEMRMTRRARQKRKRQRKWLRKVRASNWHFFNHLELASSLTDSNSNIVGSLNEIPILSADEIFMAKYMCIGNPGLQRGVSTIDFFARDEIVLRKRCNSCIARITEDMEPIEIAEAEFGSSDSSSELSWPPRVAEIDMEAGFRTPSPFERRLKKISESEEKEEIVLADNEPIPFLISPSNSDDEEVTPVPPVDPDATPVVTPEVPVRLPEIVPAPVPEVKEEEPQSDTDTFFDIEDMEKEKNEEENEDDLLTMSSSHNDLFDPEDSELNPLIDSRKLRPVQAGPAVKEIRDPEVERQVKARFDFLMEKLLFEEMGVIPERISRKSNADMRNLSIDPFLRKDHDLLNRIPSAWLTLNKNQKFKKLVPRNYVPSLATVFDVPDENAEVYEEIQFSDGHTPLAYRPYVQQQNTCEEQAVEHTVWIRPGTPIVDISSPDSDISDDECDSQKNGSDQDNFGPLVLPENGHLVYKEKEDAKKDAEHDMRGNESDVEDEQYKEDDQDDRELLNCFKSESEDEQLGDMPKIPKIPKGGIMREESLDSNPIDIASMVRTDPTIPPPPDPDTVPVIDPAPAMSTLPIDLMFEGASEADDVESDQEADEEVQNVFGRNLVPPPRPFEEPAVVALPPSPLEEKPIAILYSDEEVADEITVADEAFDILVTPPPKPPPPVVIPDEIIRPERLLDLMPPTLIFEGIDYWGCTEAQMEEALDELITERERIREELLRPPPKPRHVYQLVHRELVDGVDSEVVALEFSSSDSDDDDEEEDEYSSDSTPSDRSLSEESETVEPVNELITPTTHIVYTEGELELRPPTPPQPPEYILASRDKKRLQDKKRHVREKQIDRAVENEAWDCVLEYLKCEFYHNSYGRKPVVYVPHLNLCRGLPRHILMSYIDQMRVRRFEENELVEQLERENHLYRIKAEKPQPPPPFDPLHPIIIQAELPPRDIKLTFAEPEFDIPVRVYQPYRGIPPPRPSILKRRPLTPEPEPEPEPEPDAPEEPVVRKASTKRDWFKKKVKKVELPNPDDTKFPTEQDYSLDIAKQFRFNAHKNLLRPGTQKYSKKFIYKCRGIPGIIHIAMSEVSVRKEFIKDTRLLGAFHFMRSRERIAVLRSVGLCDYKSDQIAEILEERRMKQENPFAIALMALVMGQGTYVISFLTRVHRDGWYAHKLEDRRCRDEAEILVKYCLMYCEWRGEANRLPAREANEYRRVLLQKYHDYKILEDSCIFSRIFMAFLLTMAYSETRHFVDDVVWCKQAPMMFRVAFATLFCETTDDWQQTLFELLKELPPHDIQRFTFTGVGRHPDSINAILEFAKHTSDVQFASFLLIVGKCFDKHPFVKNPQYYEKRGNRICAPRREVYKYWFAVNNEIETTKNEKKRMKIYPELIETQQALLGLTLKYELFHAMKDKARPPMEQIFPVAVLYPQINMEKLDQQAYEVMRHYAYVLQVTHHWTASAQIFYVMKEGEAMGRTERFDTELELACSFCCTTLSYGRKKAREDKKAEKKKTEDARLRHMEAQRKRMEQGLQPQPFTGGNKKKGHVKDIPDDVDTRLRPIACLGCHKPLPRCAVCFNHMFNPIPNEEGKRGENVGFGFAACRRCHHGGHPDHLDRWFRENYRCPVNQCDCECDYDNVWDALKLHEALDMKLLGAPQIALGTHQRIRPPTPPPPPAPIDEEVEGEAVEGEEQEEQEDSTEAEEGYGME
ncbi:hypothetical protein PFISCL1PPCAC_26528, partial [Pristionchus fissidentatus]